MYNSSVDFVVKSIQKSPLVNLNGLIYQKYQNFFDDIWLEKIKKECVGQSYESLEKQEHKPRKKLSYSSILAKELKILFSNVKIKHALEKIYNTELKFSSCDLWNDSVNYFLVPHCDDDRILLSIQIYLSDCGAAGTKFFKSTVSNVTETNLWKNEYLEHEIKEIKYIRNNGYSMLNNFQNWHGVAPNQVNDRLSIYVRYI